MSKRRVFDINFPSDPPAPKPAANPVEPAVTESRRGPMATAISENAEALKARAEAEQHIRAENDRLAHEFVRLKKLGLVVDRIPLDQISTSKLVRDRATSRDPDLEELKASVRSIGLSNPIRVEQDEEGGYQLIQGFRRLSAYRALHAETGDAAYASIPAGLVAKGESLQGLYRRMVDENLVRRDISFAEMAQLALAYAKDPETGCDGVEQAVAHLYASAGRQKRSYIRHFADLLDMIGEGLRFSETIPRALGLDLKKKLSEVENAPSVLLETLAARAPHNAEAELAILREFLAGALAQAGTKGTVKAPKTDLAKTTLRCSVPAGTVRCQARDGRIELAMDKDFSEIDRHRLEAAIAAFFDALEAGDEAN